MSGLRVCCFTISLDGYGAGPDQSPENPLGVGGETLHKWFLPTRTFRAMTGQDGGSTDTDDKFAARGFENVGAWILGRNMFAHSRGDWPDDNWKRMVGRQPALPLPGLRPDETPARVDHHGRRYHLPFRHRWHPRGAETRDGGGERQGRPHRRRH